MVVSVQRLPIRGLKAGFHRFTVEEYHELIRLGLFTENDDIELLDGHLVHKMPRNPPHDGTLHRVCKRIAAAVPNGWEVRNQLAVTLSRSEPEPDILVAQGDENTYMDAHPESGDVGLIIEVSDSTLDSDREDKGRIYAGDSLPEYWIVNIPDRQIEVYTQPSGPAADPVYAVCAIFKPGQSLPLALEGKLLASFPVEELLP